MMAAQLESDTRRVPRHIAIIMDGNGRWAKQRSLPRVAGHRKGADAVRTCVTAAIEAGVQYLTLYAFSSENWNRPADEVTDLMNLLRHYLRREVAELNSKNVRLHFIGKRDRLAPDTLKLMESAEELTKDNTRLHMCIALNYGSQCEIVEAARALASAVKKGDLAPEDITHAHVADNLLTAHIPDPDLIIRTSGEQRLSNFLLWQAAYAELVFLDVLWPDFDACALGKAIDEFQQRERRYGGR
ncbi:MAG: isoprenyl transferase [Pseudomonadota bacterium]